MGLSVDETRDYKAGMASHYNALGSVYVNRADLARNDLVQAEVMFQKALKLHETLGSPVGVAASCGDLGVIYGARGDLTQAEAMFRRSVALEEELGAVENLAADYGNLGNIHRARGRLQKAEDMHRRALGCALQAATPAASGHGLSQSRRAFASPEATPSKRGCAWGWPSNCSAKSACPLRRARWKTSCARPNVPCASELRRTPETLRNSV